MVHSHRSTPKSGTVIDVSSLRHTLTAPANKSELSSSPRAGFTLEVPTCLSAKVDNAPPNPWHYNNMINKNRDEFNNLHFC